MKRQAIEWCLIGAGITLVSFVPKDAHAYRYFVDDPHDYESGDCHPDLEGREDRSYPIRDGLGAMGWTGDYWTDENAWPQDWSARLATTHTTQQP